ncbi:MAG: type IVB secretion system protein IcmM/DotJ [Proteobacteria bacterium]|nr:type IVB secretion system protein IcmM/DotJ [Pseudomonadota bacterium]
MSIENWNNIKGSKFFYVRTYRFGAQCLMISIILNLVMSLMIYYLYISRPDPDFYATSGMVPPVPLRALAEPNQSANALLPPDPVDVNNEKVIPQ